MKTPLVIQQTKRCIVLFLAGILCSTIAYVIYLLDPVQMIIKYKLQMSPGSMFFAMWRKPPLDVYLKVYVFNVTNSERFLNGEDKKLKMEETGPYIYKEILENTNVVWHKNGTISYTPTRKVVFVPEMSISDPSVDRVMVPNVPLLGVSSALHDSGFFVNYPIIQLASFLNSKPILNITSHEFLWGYEDSLVRLAGNVVPSFINFKKFGLLDRMYDEGDNIFTMNVKPNPDTLTEQGRYLSLETVNGSPGLKHWGYVDEEGNATRPENTICNRIQGATEGVVYPPNVDKRATFRIFRKAFCRAMPIVFDKEVEIFGVPGYKYVIAENYADPPEINSDNECFCKKKKQCLKKGLSDLTPCYYNFPIAVSLPHFLGGDPSLLEGLEGLKPDRKIHESMMIMQPHIGIPMYVNSRVQTNLVMHNTRYNSKVMAFNGLTIPLFWSELHIPNLPQELMILVRLAVQIGPWSQIGLILVLSLTGLALILWSLFKTVVLVQQEQEVESEEESDQEIEYIERQDSQEDFIKRRGSDFAREFVSAARRLSGGDFRIPIGYRQYTAIKIVPNTIKNMTSKSDLFS